MRTTALISAFVLALGICAHATPEALSEAEITSFLVQCIGTDTAEHPLLPKPGDGRCVDRGLQSISEPAQWSKHDWPDGRNGDEALGGQQASDSVLDVRLRFPLIVQTFDFGNSGRRFRTLDRGNGDGGDALTLLDGAAWIFFTEDGGQGQQWFVGEGCRSGVDDFVKLKSWLAFADDVVEGAWTERTARLRMTRSPDECPVRFNNAYTRYRRDSLRVPMRAVDAGKIILAWTGLVDTVLSEHFNGAGIDVARDMERFFFGRGLGKYRWEAWVELSRSRMTDADARADDLARSRRCMPLSGSEPPAPGWVMVDCRTWTNLVREQAGWSVSDFSWPGALLNELAQAHR